LINPIVVVGSQSVDLCGVDLVTLRTIVLELARELVCLVSVSNSLLTDLLNILLLALTMLLVETIYRCNMLLVL
jgi:hypothetical protein